MDKDDQDYKNFDMTGATRGIPPQIARLQAKRRAEKEQVKLENLLEPDVWQLILQKAKVGDTAQIAKINQMLRIMLT